MKKFISIVLAVVIILSCFTMTTSASGSNDQKALEFEYEICNESSYDVRSSQTPKYCNHKLYATNTFSYYDSICHLITVSYICSYCNMVVNREYHYQVHSDRNNDKYCDYCRAVYVGGSGGSGGTGGTGGTGGSGGTTSCSHYGTVVVNYKYGTMNDLYNHLVSEYRRCSKCGSSYLADTYIGSHKDTNYDRICDQCGMSGISCNHSYSTTTEYEYYDLTFHKTKTIKTCKNCKDKQESTNIKAHTDANNDKICDVCGYKEIVLATDSNATPCSHSGDTFAYNLYKKSKDAEKHSIAIHSTCDKCGQPYVSKVTDELHVDIDRDKTCDICNLVVNHRTHYDNNKDDECDFCDYIMQTYYMTAEAAVYYKEKVSFNIVAENLPEGAVVALYSYYNQSTPIITSSEGNIEWVSDPLTEQEAYVVKVIDIHGDVIINSSKINKYYIIIDVEDSFFVRIRSFFRRLFGADMTRDVGTLTIEP